MKKLYGLIAFIRSVIFENVNFWASIRRFKNNLKSKENLSWLTMLILFNVIYYVFFFQYNNIVWINICVIDIVFMFINTQVVLVIGEKNTPKTLMTFFIIIKFVAIIIGCFGHDVGLITSFISDFPKDYFKLTSTLIAISSIAISLLYIVYAFSAATFNSLDYLIYSPKIKPKWVKMILLFLVAASEFAFYLAIYRYVIYEMFYNESEKLISNLVENSRLKGFEKTFNILKPLLAYLTLPVLYLVNKYNGGNVFFSKFLIIHGAYQEVLFSNSIELHKTMGDAILPVLMITWVAVSWFTLLIVVLFTIKKNINLDKSKHELPYAYTIARIKNHQFQRFYQSGRLLKGITYDQWVELENKRAKQK